MKTRIALFMSLMLVAMLVLAACGGEEDPTATPVPEVVEQATEAPTEPTEEPMEEPTEAPAEPTEAPAEEPTEEPMEEPEMFITVWADDTRAPVLQELAEDFQATYGVGLIVEQVMDINDQLPIAAPAGEGPDIFIGPNDRLGGWVDSGLVAPIDLGDKVGDVRSWPGSDGLGRCNIRPRSRGQWL